ncbi:MAG: CobW family GTP-binding protein [Enterobacteriaceae bacterium]
MTDMIPAPIPVTLLTGFLGSGKTTLLNHLLTHYPTERIAIVENEFGAVNIDSALLNQPDNIEIIELSNGCVCCNVRGELTQALSDLLSRRQRGDIHFERIILETTGLADPAPLIQTFFVDENLRERLLLDAVITLVDSVHAQQQLNEHPVAVSQVGFADRLILTKSDLIDNQAQEQLLDRLRKINAKALIHSARQGELDKAHWLDIRAFNMSENLTVDGAFIKSVRPLTQSAAGQTTLLQGRSELLPQSWNDNISSYVFEGGEMDIKQIGAFMKQCIERHGNDLLRYKGIIAIAGEPRRLIIQGVHKVAGFDYGSPWQPDETPQTLLVMIGRYLPVEQWRTEFKAAELKSL